MKNLWGLIFLASSLTASSQTLDCAKFRNGKFIMKDENGTIHIERQGNLQIEKMEGAGRESRLTVTWVDACTYLLKPTKKTRKHAQTALPVNAILTVTIIEVKENSYVQTTTSNFADFKFTSELIQIE